MPKFLNNLLIRWHFTKYVHDVKTSCWSYKQRDHQPTRTNTPLWPRWWREKHNLSLHDWMQQVQFVGLYTARSSLMSTVVPVAHRTEHWATSNLQPKQWSSFDQQKCCLNIPKQVFEWTSCNVNIYITMERLTLVKEIETTLKLPPQVSVGTAVCTSDGPSTSECISESEWCIAQFYLLFLLNCPSEAECLLWWTDALPSNSVSHDSWGPQTSSGPQNEVQHQQWQRPPPHLFFLLCRSIFFLFRIIS